MRKALCLDIGGTNLRCALINENYEIEKVIVKSTSNSTVEVFLSQVEEIIEEEIPLIDLPKTGGASGIGFCMIGVAALAAGFMLRSKEEDEE